MSGGLSNGARESCGCGDLSHCSHKGCRLLVSGDRWFIEVGGANRCEICDGKVQFFCLINGGNRDVFWFWFQGIFIVVTLRTSVRSDLELSSAKAVLLTFV